MQKKYKRTPASINLENKQSAIKSVSVFAVVIVIILLWPYSILSWQSICFLTILFVYLFSEVVSYISRKKNTSNLEIYFSSECIFFTQISIKEILNLKTYQLRRLTEKIHQLRV